MVTFLIYLLVMCEELKMFFSGWSGFIVAGFAWLFIMMMGYFISEGSIMKIVSEARWKFARRCGFAMVWLGLFGVTLGALLPTQKNMAIIVAGSASYQVITSEPAQQIGQKALLALNKKLDEIIGEGQNVQGPKESPKPATQSSGKREPQGESA